MDKVDMDKQPVYKNVVKENIMFKIIANSVCEFD